MAEAERQKIKPKDETDRQQTIAGLKRQFKALAARDIWDMNEYFAISNEEGIRGGISHANHIQKS